jgi:asparagine synthase (glutamine-hydrolysing)
MLDGRSEVMLTFNGEIYNYVELRAELEAIGVRFKTHSDTEVLLRSYLHWGEDCVQHLNGEWAFAVWDDRYRRLFASRDRLGIRPLHYAIVNGDLVFGSEVKSLLLHPGLYAEPDVLALDDIFTFWVPTAGRTFFEGVSQLLPGHSLRFEAGRLETHAYWAPDFAESAQGHSEDECLEELEALLVDSVRLRLRSDVPVGAYLSGGLDSALTTALVKKHTNTDLQTFSVTFDDREFDESQFQLDASRHLGTDHHSVNCSGTQISSMFPEVVRHIELPVLRTGPVPMYLLSKLTHEMGCKVAITGEGADEIFGGYDIFKEAKVRQFWARDINSSIRPELLRRLYPYMPALQSQSKEYLKAFFQVSETTASSPLFSHLPRWTMTSMLKRFYSRELLTTLGDRDPLREISDQLPDRYDSWTQFSRAQYLELAYLLPGYILSSQGDRMLMANSVEGRFPFLDHRIAEFGMRLPVQLKMPGLNEKYLLKRLARRLVPDSIISRPKQPYRAPDASSFFDAHGNARHDYVLDALSENAVRMTGLFDPAKVAGLVRKCAAGRATGVKDNQAFVGILSTQLLTLAN